MIKKKKQPDVETKRILSELEEIIERLGFRLRYEKGNFEGGYCLLKETSLFVINSKCDAERRISIICRNLDELGIENIFIKPHIREIIERELKKRNKPVKEDV